MKKPLSLLLAVFATSLMAGCGSGNSAPPPVATHLLVSAPATVTAGMAFSVTVSALDSSGAVVSTYSGKVHLTSSDAQAVLPGDLTLTNGIGNFSVTLKTAAGQNISAADTVTASISGTCAGITVNAGPAATVSIQVPSAETIGLAFQITVNVLDAYGNVATSYTGTVHFTSTDSLATLPGNTTLTNGSGTYSIMFKTIGAQTITASDTVTASLKGASNAINVVSNAPTHFGVAAPASTTTRATFQITVTALDAANNVPPGYSGTVHFSSTDGNAILPANSTLTAGVGTFSATFETAGNQTVTATDTGTASITGASNSVSVTAAAALTITSGAPPNGTFEVLYGPTVYLECHWNFFRGTYLVCGPCTISTGCSSLPPCRNFPTTGYCKEVIHGFPLTATGGVPPYKWSATGLPPGLNVNSSNRIVGTPTSPGTYTVSVTLSDSGTPQVSPLPTSTHTIMINDPPPPVINATPAPPFGAVNLPYSFTFTAASPTPPSTLTWRVSAGTPPPGLTFSPAGVLSGIPTATGTTSITLIATDQFKQDSASQQFTIQIFAHGFKATGRMAGPRIAHTATLLSNGIVFLAGGTDGSGTPIATAEMFNPATGTFSPTGSMGTARAHFAATLLCDLSSLPCNDNRVLVTGGLDTNGQPLATAEIYDPRTGKFSPTTGAMLFVHAAHTATLLKTGKVLVAGWGNAVAELFDPATGTFAQTGSMATARVGHTATLLSSGKVLVTGGIQGVPPATTTLAEAELYDPSSGSFTATVGTLATARQSHTASLLSDGTVLVTGGLDSNNHALASAEVFNPSTQMFTATKDSMATARANHTATVLNDKTVLVTGGDDGSGPLSTAEVYDPTAETFSPTGSMGNTRKLHIATLLNDGTVLVTGGIGGGEATAELYQ